MLKSAGVAELFALEGSLDVANAEGGPFGMLAVQLRVSRPSRGPQFATVGHTYAVASRRNANAPRDRGLSLGGGLLLPFPQAAAVALRADGQVMLFRRHHPALRLTIGITVAME